MSILKKLSIFIVLLLISTNVYANYAIIETKKIEVNITGIYDKIDKIELFSYGDNIDFKEVFNNTFPTDGFDMQFSNSAIRHDDVDPFSKEDYVENTNYDNKKYKVTVTKSYSYKFEHKDEDTEIEYTFDKKYSDTKALKEAIMSKKYGSYGSTNILIDEDNYSNELVNYLDSATITCDRTISYKVLKYDLVKEISPELIKDNELKFDITDFTSLANNNHPEDSGFMLRFYHNGSEYPLDFDIGNNLIIQDSHLKTRPTVRKVGIEYSHNYTGEVQHYNDDKNMIIKVLTAIIITIFVETIIAIIMKINKYEVIIPVNIITQLLLHSVTIILMIVMENIPLYFYFIAEPLIVLIEYLLYSFLIKDIPKKKLCIYSLIANIASFGLSLLTLLIK